MSKPIAVEKLPEFDVADYLSSDQDMADYLNLVLAENDAALLAAAMGDIAKAKGMTQIAQDSGLTREALYKALRPNAQPRFDTIARVCQALGLKLVATPVAPQRTRRQAVKAA